MTNNIFLLTKINFASIFKNMFNFGSRKNVPTTKSKATTICLVCLFIVLMLFSFGSMYLPFAMEMSKTGTTEYIFIYAGIQSTVFLLIFSIFESSAYIFKTKDFESLTSLPLKNYEIVISKYLAMLLTSYVYSAFIFLPAIVVYFMFTPITIIGIVFAIFGFILFPLFPSAIGCFFGYLVALITSRVKRSNLISIIISIIFFAAVLVFSFSMNSIIASIMSYGEMYISALAYVMPPIAFYIRGIVYCDWFYTLIYVLIQILPTALVMFVLTVSYKRINQYFLKNKALVSLKKIEYKTSSNFISFTKIEIKKIFSIPVWTLNSLFGTVFYFLIPILLKVNKFGLTQELGLGDLSGLNATIIIMGFAIITSMSITTCSSISFESKNLWLSKGLPISTNQLFASKIFSNIILVGPFILVGGLLSIILFFKTLAWYEMIFIFIVPLFSLIACSTFGLLVNLIFPKTNYDNPAQVAKQSLAVFISVFGGMFVHIIIFVLIFGLIKNVNIAGISLIFLGIYVLLFGLSTIFLTRKGKNLWNELV